MFFVFLKMGTHQLLIMGRADIFDEKCQFNKMCWFLQNGRSKFRGRVADFIKCPYIVIKMMMQNPCERQGKWRSIKIHCKYQYNLCLPQRPKS